MTYVEFDTPAYVELYYPSILADNTLKARAVAIARETSTLYVVRGSDVTILESRGVRFGSRELRFYKTSGAVRGSLARTWRCAGPITEKQYMATLTLAALKKAGDIFGTKSKHWLQTPQLALGNKTPRSLFTSPDGARLVLDVLGRINDGTFS